MQKSAVRLEDVAKAAGVSRGTASNVFSRPEIVREEMREKVLAAAQQLGYAGPDPKGRLLRAGKVNAIGVATAEPLSYFFDDPFARTVMSGISQECDATGAGISGRWKLRGGGAGSARQGEHHGIVRWGRRRGPAPVRALHPGTEHRGRAGLVPEPRRAPRRAGGER